MNQHFIYNTLNQVQYFINKGERDASLTYIIRLSRLLRQWMHDTEQAVVSIMAERRLLHSYLALEQMRFADRFSFEVTAHVSAPEKVFILPHAIFPLAEYAVAWSLQNPGKGEINIHLYEELPFIRCTVEAKAGGTSLAAGLHLVPQQNNLNRLCNASS